MATAVAQLNGQTVSVFTRADGDVLVLDPDTGAFITDVQPPGQRFGQPTRLTVLTPWDGVPGNQLLVAGSLGGTGCQVLQEVGGILTQVPFGPGGAISGTADQVRAWFPGYAAGRLQVTNNSPVDVAVAMASKPEPGYGCWLNTSVTGGPAAFPAASPTTVAAGATSPVFFAAALTGGANCSDCAAAEGAGEWSAYVIITPAGDPADEHIVKLQAQPDRTLAITDQAGGGYLTVTLAQASATPGSWGTWQLTVTGDTTPTPQPSPAVTGSRVTPAGWPGPAVYRFDVTGAAYQLPALGNQVMVAPLLVQGSVDGTSWTSLGTLVPATGPSVAAGPPAELTLGQATFWWENPAGAPAYRLIRVGLGPAGVPSQVTLADLPYPDDGTKLSGVAVSSTTSDNVARPVASGVDQAPLLVQVQDANTNPLPASDKSYQRIYYRDASGNLVTNLFRAGADPAGFIGVSPYPGAYPNDGSLARGPAVINGTYHYVATTSTEDQQDIHGYVGGALNETVPAASNPIEVHAAAIAPVVNEMPPASAAAGISLAGCADFTGTGLCCLAPSTAPALFLDTADGGVQIGVLTAAQAVTSVHSLPLQQTAGTPEHLLAAAPLTVSETAATLAGTSPFGSGDAVDTTLVTHGVLARVTDIAAS